MNDGNRQVAFLRAVNVGGRSIVKMADVQAAFTAAGCANVSTYIASGNVIFDAPVRDAGSLRGRINQNMRALLGVEPVIVFRTANELNAIVKAAPFGALVKDAGIKLYVAFLTGRPTTTPRFPLVLEKEALEAIATGTRDVLIVSRRKPNGFYGFPANWIEKELGVAATARNWSTVTKIVDLVRETRR